MKIRIEYLLLSVLAVLCANGCMEKLPEMNGGGETPEVAARKVVNRNVVSEAGCLLVKLTESGVAAMESSDTLFSSEGVASSEMIFGRWYRLEFDRGRDLDNMAGRLSVRTEVETVQFNALRKKASDGISKQWTPGNTVAVKSSAGDGLPFTDPGLKDQWHYINFGDAKVAPTARKGADINVRDAWRLTTGDPSIIVAVIDEPVQYDHPDLAANMWANPGEIPGNGIDDDGNGYIDDIHGYNFVRNQGEMTVFTYNNTGHGTHVAGTVAAVNNNRNGVCGVAGGSGEPGTGVKIMSLQIFDGQTDAGDDATARAIRYAMDKGAHIIQCSWGYVAGTIMSDSEFSRNITAEALQEFAHKPNDVLDGGLIIFASGNDETEVSSYPGAYRDYISVTGTAADGLPAYYTNYGPGSNIAAPGGEYYTGGKNDDFGLVLSTMPTKPIRFEEAGKVLNTAVNYGYMQGTSMSCPHVSGVAALGLSYLKKLGRQMTVKEFSSLLLTSVDDLNSRLKGTKTTMVGYGMGKLPLYPYKNNMGTGGIDAWKFLMNIEGTPMMTLKVGERQLVDFTPYLGGGAASMEILSVSMSSEDMAAIGLESQPSLTGNRLYLTPTKTGSGKLTVTAIGGGTDLGSDSSMGGMKISREISILSRDIVSENGGWL